MSVTLFKLSLRNARRQAKDYLIYFITIILSVSMLYAFNALVVSDEIQNLSEMMKASMPWIIAISSIAVVIIIGWLLNYTMNFMLTKRSRELGTYILMGTENKQVAHLFFTENLIVGAAALAAGILGGNLLFQALRAIVLNLFEMPYNFSFYFSFKSLVLTLLYFVLIYLFALLRSRKRITKMKIRDLLYFDKQNETEVNFVKKEKKRRLIFIISIILGVIGTVLLCLGVLGNKLLSIIGGIMIVVFLYGFFISFSSGVPAYYNKRPERKYKNTNLMVFRSLSSKMTTLGVTMATIALLLVVIISAEGIGLLFSNQLKRTETLYTNYDLFIAIYDKDEVFDFSAYDAYIAENISVKKDYKYFVYDRGSDDMNQYMIKTKKETKYKGTDSNDSIMKMSDYMALRELLGYEKVQMSENGYIIHCQQVFGKTIEKYNEPLDLNGTILSKEGVYTEDFTQYLFMGNGKGILFVVPDEVAQTHKISHFSYAAMTNNPVRGDIYDGLENIWDTNIESNIDEYYNFVLSPDNTKDENAALYAMIVFPLFYLSMILTMVAMTILTTQLLSDAGRYKKHYAMLNNLGMDRKDMIQAIRRQFTVFFAMPVIPPILISSVLIGALGSVMDAGVITDLWHLLSIIMVMLGLFLSIYIVYIFAAYVSFKRNVLPVE